MIFRRRRRGAAGTVAPEFEGTTEELAAEIKRVTAANREQRDRDAEYRLLRLRHLLGVRLLDEAAGAPSFPEPDFDSLPEADGLPDIDPAQLTPELLRAGILRDGSVLVRGMMPRDDALRLAEEIDRAFDERERHDAGGTPAAGYYREFEPGPRFDAIDARPWVKEGGGVLAADSPMLAFDMFELFEAAGLPDLAAGYLGEATAISAQKTTLRKAAPEVGGAWHQDGKFMGPVRALNAWVSLSRCGDESPGLDIVPRRLNDYVAAQTEEAVLSYQVSDAKAAEAAGPDHPIIRPIFEPGDVLLFDELCLHQTGSDPSMPKPRYAIESWFFGPSGFPGEYAPIAA